MTRILTLIAGASLVLASCTTMQSTTLSSPSENASPAAGVDEVVVDTPVPGSFARPDNDERTSGDGSAHLPIPEPPVPESEAGAPIAEARVIGSLVRVSGLQARGAAGVTSADEVGGVLEGARMPVPEIPLPKADGPAPWSVWGLKEAAPVPYTLGVQKPRSSDTPAEVAQPPRSAEPATENAPEQAEKVETAEPPDRPLPGPSPSSDPVPPQASEAAAGSEVAIPAERVTTSLNSTTTVTLPGLGWTYLGNSEAVDYDRRAVQEGETRFTFRPTEPGRHTLQFQRHDLSKGDSQTAEVLLTVTEDEIRAERTIGETPNADEDRSETTAASDARPTAYRAADGAGQYDEARELEADGKQSAALDAYLRQYDGNPRVAYEVAGLADELNESSIAEYFWNEVASGTSAAGAAGAAAIEAHRRLFDGALAALQTAQDAAEIGTAEIGTAGERPSTSDGVGTQGGSADTLEQAAFTHFQELARHGHTPSREKGVVLARALLRNDMPGQAEEVLNAVGAGGESTPAEILFLIAQAYEAQQRPDHAIRYYRRLLDRFVLSSYYERARERYEYLRRHFLHVR